MKRLLLIVIMVTFFISGCGELIFSQTGNAKQGQTYNEFKKEQKENEKEWRLHQMEY